MTVACSRTSPSHTALTAPCTGRCPSPTSVTHASQWSRAMQQSHHVNPLTPTVAVMGTAIKHPVPDRVKPPFVIFDILALVTLRAERHRAERHECQDVKNYKWWLNPVWHRKLFIAVPITATVGVKGLKTLILTCLLAYLHSPHLFTQAHLHVHAIWLQLLNLANHTICKEVHSLVIRCIDHTSHQYSESRENRRTLPWSKYWMTS